MAPARRPSRTARSSSEGSGGLRNHPTLSAGPAATSRSSSVRVAPKPARRWRWATLRRSHGSFGVGTNAAHAVLSILVMASPRVFEAADFQVAEVLRLARLDSEFDLRLLLLVEDDDPVGSSRNERRERHPAACIGLDVAVMVDVEVAGMDRVGHERAGLLVVEADIAPRRAGREHDLQV